MIFSTFIEIGIVCYTNILKYKNDGLFSRRRGQEDEKNIIIIARTTAGEKSVKSTLGKQSKDA